MARDPAVSPGSTSFVSTPSPTAPGHCSCSGQSRPPKRAGAHSSCLPRTTRCLLHLSPSRSQETFQHCRLDSGARSPTSLLLVVSTPTSAAPPGPRALTSSLCRHLPRNTSACDPPGACSHGPADRCSACPQTGETCLPSSEAEFLMGNSPCSPTGCKSTFLGPHGNFAACLLYPVL